MLLIFSGHLKSQEIDTFYLHYPISKYDTVIYKRIIEFNKEANLYHVKDYFENGQIQMQGTYSKFDRNVKESLWCNYRTNTKQGLYQEWFKNGQIKFIGNYKNGLRHGLSNRWSDTGQIIEEDNWVNGQLHGNAKYWTEQGELQFDLVFEHGLKLNPENVNYHYMSYLPADYNLDTTKSWPLIIYLHGGSHRGTDLHKLYTYGIPDQIYRGREFPFIIVSPQCPKYIWWSSDNWFENFYDEIITKYRVDTNRVYLTGVSLGGSGTWYLAAKFPEKFAAIAPICGATSHIDFIDNNINRLAEIPIWAFHGRIDNMAPFEETERIIDRLKGKNKNLKFTVENNIGHWIQWLVYPGQELYDWFLQYDKRLMNKN
jgi:pimeloyl-ACP methyl ester carboxylesterase